MSGQVARVLLELRSGSGAALGTLAGRGVAGGAGVGVRPHLVPVPLQVAKLVAFPSVVFPSVLLRHSPAAMIVPSVNLDQCA